MVNRQLSSDLREFAESCLVAGSADEPVPGIDWNRLGFKALEWVAKAEELEGELDARQAEHDMVHGLPSTEEIRCWHAQYLKDIEAATIRREQDEAEKTS